MLTELKASGIGLALDDFGTGYSSLSYLRKFPFDKVKIDKSFIDELTGNADCLAIVEAIIRLCGILKMGTAAEGVETQDQLDLLTSIGCELVQGYLVGHPRPFIRSVDAWNLSTQSRGLGDALGDNPSLGL